MWLISSASAPSVPAGAPARPRPASPACGTRASARAAGSRSVTATPSARTTPARSSSSTPARPGASASPCRSSGGTGSSASPTASSSSCTSSLLTTAVRVLHPFTRDAVDFQPLASLRHQVVRLKESLLDMNAAVCRSASSATSIAVVVWFLRSNVVRAADPGSDWEVLHTGLYVWCALPFQGRLYATLSNTREIVQLYPPRRKGQLVNSAVIALVPHLAHRMLCDFYLVESGGRMLLVIRHPGPPANGLELSVSDWWRLEVCKLYVVDLNSQHNLIPVKSLGDSTLFLSRERWLSVSARDLPSLSSNSIYSSLPRDPIVVYSLGTGLFERLAESCQIHDRKDRIRPSLRPFTIADHLITYCNPREWSNGLMFHEYHYIPESFEELIKKIKAQNRELRIPHITLHSR